MTIKSFASKLNGRSVEGVEDSSFVVGRVMRLTTVLETEVIKKFSQFGMSGYLISVMKRGIISPEERRQILFLQILIKDASEDMLIKKLAQSIINRANRPDTKNSNNVLSKIDNPETFRILHNSF